MQRDVPRWLSPVSLTLSIIGLLASGYLTYEHLTAGQSFACPANATVDCVKVTTSAWSTFLGIPVAYLGLVFFVPLIVLSLPRFFTAVTRTWDVARLLWTGIGLAMALYLVWAELFHIGSICLWCTAVHLVTLLLLCVYLMGQALIVTPRRRA